ncbi:MAG: bifunctional nuclease family protein [Halobacteriota archaeon]|uniref:bifunctional nuclease family protein n=1 Tax=Natronomonas sp. TaxID=2184060 RepID=UPI003974AE90
MTHEATVDGLGISVDDEGAEGAPVVVLRARGQALPIFISADQAKSISHAIDGRPFERPLTHDLFVEMLTEFGGAIDRIRIDGLADRTFLAKIDAERYADGNRRELTFDARPSDAIALALRVECPIHVDDDVIDAAGRPPDAFELR